MHTDPVQIAEALAAPFEPGEVKFKPQSVSGNRALVIPFVDARTIMDRLDDVLGVMNWQDAYTPQPDGSVLCRLSCRIGGEWIAKEDVGGQSEQKDEGDRDKSAFSDALKRAAVKWGVGRYLYRVKPWWVDYDPAKRQFVREPQLPGQAPPAKTTKKQQMAADVLRAAACKPSPPLDPVEASAQLRRDLEKRMAEVGTLSELQVIGREVPRLPLTSPDVETLRAFVVTQQTRIRSAVKGVA